MSAFPALHFPPPLSHALPALPIDHVLAYPPALQPRTVWDSSRGRLEATNGEARLPVTTGGLARRDGATLGTDGVSPLTAGAVSEWE